MSYTVFFCRLIHTSIYNAIVTDNHTHQLPRNLLLGFWCICSANHRSYIKQASLYCMANVFGASAPFEIFDVVILLVPVDVVNL